MLHSAETAGPPLLPTRKQKSPQGSVLTSWVTRQPIWMGGGVGTHELFTCQARGLALNMRLASLRLAEEDGHSLTRLVPWKSHPHPRENYFCEGRSWLQTSLFFLLHLPQGALIWFGNPRTCHSLWWLRQAGAVPGLTSPC